MKSLPTDSDLIASILNGSQKSFKHLYDRYSRFHFLTCLRYVKHNFDAQDLLQESYITIFRDLKQFDMAKGNFSQWSKRVVINVCLQHLRKKRFIVDIDKLLPFSEKTQVDADIFGQLNLKDMTKVISELPKGYRTVFNMYVIDGFTHKEIADALNISESTSKTQLMKAKKMLKKSIDKNEFQLTGAYA